MKEKRERRLANNTIQSSINIFFWGKNKIEKYKINQHLETNNKKTFVIAIYSPHNNLFLATEQNEKKYYEG